MKRIKMDFQTGIIVVISTLIVLFLETLVLYAFSDNFRQWFDATFRAESIYMYEGTDGKYLPLPPHTHDYYRQPVKDVSYYSKENAKDIVDFYKRIASSFRITSGEGQGQYYSIQYGKDTYKLYFYEKDNATHYFTIQIQP